MTIIETVNCFLGNYFGILLSILPCTLTISINIRIHTTKMSLLFRILEKAGVSKNISRISIVLEQLTGYSYN